MGVPGFFSWLLRNKKWLYTNKLIIDNIDKKIKYLMLDTNCLLHPCVNYILEKYKKGELELITNKPIRYQLEDLIWKKIKFNIDDMIKRLQPEYIYIAIDGVAPMGKILQQRQRRYRFLFDKKIKLNTNYINEQIDKNIIVEEIGLDGINIPLQPISSIELTPGTDYMERLHNNIEAYVKYLHTQNIKYIYSSYHVEGEGEHKILQYIKNHLNSNDIVVIYGLDADLLFLSLSIGEKNNLYIMREKQIFNNTPLDMDDYIDYNYVEIAKLHEMIKKLNITTYDFIVICYLIGNDFLPGILTTDIKKGGLDKIITAYEKVKTKIPNTNIISINNHNSQNKIYINHDFIKELFIELLWTEKWIWKNINRDKLIDRNVKPEIDESNNKFNNINNDKNKNLKKFISGESSNTDCLDKIEFSTSIEYYNYYFGIDDISIDKNIIKNMVQEYITGIEWCIRYYLNDCISWKWGYNYMITPLISDIIKFYPTKIDIKKHDCELKPIEQLILAIPPDTYKYVINTKIINKLKKEKSIGYMFPESFDIDINKESIFWKCQVKIPMVEYEEYINIIKNININDKKNIKHAIISNYT